MNIVISGPRQSGKTFIARAISQLFPEVPIELNNLISATKSLIQNPESTRIMVIDDCSTKDEIMAIEAIAKEKESNAAIIYCIESEVGEFTDELVVIDLRRSSLLN